MSRPYRFALIGCGFFAQNHLQAWAEMSDVELVATCDIIGGNSGSPMIDAEQNVVGLIFDGNIEMLGNNYVFDDEVSRTVSVHPAIIIESLRKIYNAADLAALFALLDSDSDAADAGGDALP